MNTLTVIETSTEALVFAESLFVLVNKGLKLKCICIKFDSINHF